MKLDAHAKTYLKTYILRAEATRRPDLFSKPCKKYALATLEDEGQNTNGRSMTILQPQLTLTTAASAPKTPLATRRKDVTRDPLDARERVTYTI